MKPIIRHTSPKRGISGLQQMAAAKEGHVVKPIVCHLLGRRVKAAVPAQSGRLVVILSAHGTVLPAA
ncbi:MAG: hypothetical protein OXF56_08200 [Rhodobacteraceae bacterium]|nr:hypothetical protein [Paracoccaceae bacterium]